MKNTILLFLIPLVLINPCFAKIVTIDIVEIYKNYSLVLEANKEVDKAEASFKRILETAQLEIKALEAQEGKEKELALKRSEIQAVIDQQVEALQDSKDTYNTQINRNIAQALQEFATENKIDLVVEKGYVMSPLEDLTQEFIKKLEKNKSSKK